MLRSNFKRYINGLGITLIVMAGTTLAPSSFAAESCENGHWCEEYDTYIMDAIDDFGFTDIFFKSAADSAENYCSNFKSLSPTLKKKFWAKFMAALSRTETEDSRGMWDRYNWSPEPLGKDAVTHHQVISEGLMQISYQDASQYGCTPKNLGWDHDQHLDVHDKTKSIFNAKINLQCGVRILASQLKNHQSIIYKGSAWHPLHGKGRDYKTLKSNWKYLKKIGQVDFCK